MLTLVRSSLFDQVLDRSWRPKVSVVHWLCLTEVLLLFWLVDWELTASQLLWFNQALTVVLQAKFPPFDQLPHTDQHWLFLSFDYFDLAFNELRDWYFDQNILMYILMNWTLSHKERLLGFPLVSFALVIDLNFGVPCLIVYCDLYCSNEEVNGWSFVCITGGIHKKTGQFSQLPSQREMLWICPSATIVRINTRPKEW